jgi:uncharacterized membrane protein YecN with MAPEG domain
VYVTPLYAGLLALFFFALSLRVIGYRRGGISLGDGGKPEITRAIRGHANFAEYVPLALLLLALLELSRISIYVLHALGLALLVARVLHGYALSYTRSFPFGRVWGTGLTLLVLVCESVLCLYQAWRGHLLN